jgi:hypothetical protein
MLPIKIAKKSKEVGETVADSKLVEQYKFELLVMTYKTLDAKQTIIDEMNQKFP